MSVRLNGLSFRYPAGTAPALSGVSAVIAPNAITLVTGQLGAGCSTLLLTMAGLAPHLTGGERNGEVETLGHDPASPLGRAALAGRVALLLPTPWTQLSGMAFTVWHEVAFGPANLGWHRERIAESVERALVQMRVQHLASRDPRTLSGGELQRVMFAAVAATEPEVLLLDEPSLELDPASATHFYELLPALARQASVVLATTDLDRAVEVAHQVLLLEDGKVLADGTPDSVLGAAERVAAGCATTVAEIAHRAGVSAPLPLTVDTALERLGR